jgi:hypothetical protein
MSEDRGVVREIAWKEIFPWLSLARALRLAVQVRLMVLASAAMVVTMLGWSLLGYAFSGSAEGPRKGWIEPYRMTPWSMAETRPPAESAAAQPAGSETAAVDLAVADSAADKPADGGEPRLRPRLPAGGGTGLPTAPTNGITADKITAPSSLADMPPNVLTSVAWKLSSPFRQLFDRNLTFAGLAFALLCALWALAVWSLAGGAITRTVALQLAREENIGLGAALRFARKRFRHYFTAPLFPLLGVLLFVLPMALVGLLLRWEGIGAGLVGIVWPFYLLAGLVMTIFVTGLLFGWPLLFTMISTEGGDSFGAMSHAYSYVFQRPLYYLFLVIVAAALGVLGATAVFAFAEAVIYLAAWGASWGGGGAVLNGGEAFDATFGAKAIGFWAGCVRLVPLGFAASYFWTAATAIYFLLRLSTDGNETDEVFLDDQDEAFAMPPLKTDAHGVPMAADGQPANDRSNVATARDGVTEQPE